MDPAIMLVGAISAFVLLTAAALFAFHLVRSLESETTDLVRENDRLRLALDVSVRPDSQEQVTEFQRAFKRPVRDTPTADIPAEESNLRIKLIEEELEELRVAVAAGDIIEIADALGDLKYVVEGGGTDFGVDLNAVVDAIHSSNMSKLGEDGLPLISDGTDGFPKGKVLKGPNYFKPDIAAALDKTAGRERVTRAQRAQRILEFVAADGADQ